MRPRARKPQPDRLSENSDELVVGKISGPYGIKGWVKVYSYTDPIDQIFDYAPWQISKGKRRQALAIIEGKRQGRGLIARLEGIEDRTQAELLTGWDISVPRDRLPALEEGDYYWYELEGLTVVNLDNEILGRVDHLVPTGANDVLEVRPDDGSIDERTRLVPFVMDEIVKSVDLDAGRILVDWDSDY